MPDMMPSELSNSILGKLYDVLTNGDDKVPKSEDNFFSWATPGIPFQDADFDFLTQGFTGVIKKAAIDELTPVAAPAAGGAASPPAPPALTPELRDKLLAQDAAKLYMQAENFARLVDFVPDTSGINQQFQKLTVMSNEGTLSEIYDKVLRMSQVMESELSDDQKKKIEKFRSLLSVKKKKKNLIDDTETEIEVPSPLVEAYNQGLKTYTDAVLEYNSHRIDALAADDPKAVHFWALNANALYQKVQAAKNDWVTNGYKDDYEAMAAYIDQVMARDMALLKKQYKEELDKARITGLASGSDFYFTSVVPGNFVKSSGWTTFEFNSSHIATYSKSSWNKWSAGGGFNIGLFSIGAHAAGSHSDYKGTFDSNQFRLKFSMTQVPIVRPWFKSGFLTSKSWRFDENQPDVKGQMLSDGGNPPGTAPKGMLPAYPTSMVCLKDLSLYLGNTKSVTEWMNDQISGGGSVGYGPFCVSASYARGSSTYKWNYDHDDQSIRVPGMQVIGFRCHVLPKSPMPLPSITRWI